VELATGLHPLEALDHQAHPGVEAAGQVGPGGLVAAGELAGERAERAAGAAALLVLRDQPVEPPPDVVEAVDAADQRALAVDGLADTPGDHGSDQVTLVGEVVVQLALAGPRRFEDLVEAGARRAPLSHERGGGVDDALAAPPAAPRERFLGHGTHDSRLD
jgi:hypothetical protein